MLKKAANTSFETFVFSNLFISLSAVTLTLSSYLVMLNSGLEGVSFHLVAFVFFSTLFTYNFYITGYSFTDTVFSLRERWIHENGKTVKGILFLSVSGIIYNSFFLSTFHLIFLIHLGILSMLYIFPVQIGGKQFSLRGFPLLKVFILTYVWASATVFLPAIDLEKWNDSNTVWVFIERFLFILALAIPFDIRDYVRDKKEKVKTIPGLIGVSNSKKLSIGILLIYMMISLIVLDLDYVSVSRIFSGTFAIFLISKINDEVSDSFYMFWIDGVMIFHFIVLSFSSFLF